MATQSQLPLQKRHEYQNRMVKALSDEFSGAEMQEIEFMDAFWLAMQVVLGPHHAAAVVRLSQIEQ